MLSGRYTQIAIITLIAAVFLALLLTNVGVAGAANPKVAQSCDQLIRFQDASFPKPTAIDNRLLPLVPGTQITLEGSTSAGTHRVVLTVTDLTKVVDGVRSVVLWDLDIENGQLLESELTFFAQDIDGNVWNLGEYPEEYVDGEFQGAPSTWISGYGGAKAGIHMLAKPRAGTPTYLQGQALSVGFFDCAQVYQTGQSVSLPSKNYTNVLVINEWSPLDPDGGIQRKYYAPTVGNVQITAVDDPEAENLVLVKIARLKSQAMASVREEALRLDARGYENSNAYRHTSPAQ